MTIAILRSDHSFRSLYPLPQGDSSKPARIPAEWFEGSSRIDYRWGLRRAAYAGDSAFTSSAVEFPRCELAQELAKPVGDFPHFWGVNAGVFSLRAFTALCPIIGASVEFLPLHCRDGIYHAFKVLRIVDCLDRDRSSVEWRHQVKKNAAKPRSARKISRFEFRLETLREVPIFCIPELPFGSHVFVTDIFIDEVRNRGLNGFAFEIVWPPRDDRARFVVRHLRKSGRRPQQ